MTIHLTTVTIIEGKLLLDLRNEPSSAHSSSSDASLYDHNIYNLALYLILGPVLWDSAKLEVGVHLHYAWLV